MCRASRKLAHVSASASADAFAGQGSPQVSKPRRRDQRESIYGEPTGGEEALIPATAGAVQDEDGRALSQGGVFDWSTCRIQHPASGQRTRTRAVEVPAIHPIHGDARDHLCNQQSEGPSHVEIPQLDATTAIRTPRATASLTLAVRLSERKVAGHMRRRRLMALGALMLAVASPATPNTAAAGRDDPVEQAFLRSVWQYVALRDEVTRGAPLLESSPDPGKIHAAAEARAGAIAAVRAHARIGDVFTAEVQDPLRGRIRNALAEHGYSEADMLLFINHDSDPRAVLAVNGPFPWAFGSAMVPPCVIAALPPLPAGLEYRFARTALVLVDVDANLVVDILPEVLRELSYARRSEPSDAPAGYE